MAKELSREQLHSLGGAASILVAREDPSIVGCCDIDGALIGGAKAVSQPALMIFAERERNNPEEQRMFQEWDTFTNHPAVYSCTIRQVDHMDFCFHPVLKWLLGDKTLSGALKAHYAATQAILAFSRFILHTT